MLSEAERRKAQAEITERSHRGLIGCVNSLARISLCSAGLSCHFNETIIDLLIVQAWLNTEAALAGLQRTFPQAQGSLFQISVSLTLKARHLRCIFAQMTLIRADMAPFLMKT